MPEFKLTVNVRAMNVSAEARPKVVDDRQDFTGELAQKEKRWYPLDDIRLVDRQIECEAHILVHISSREHPELVAYFHRNGERLLPSGNHLECREGVGANECLFGTESGALA